MNRRERRANGQRGHRRLTQAQIRRVTACPDCNADMDSAEVGPGVYQVAVFHTTPARGSPRSSEPAATASGSHTRRTEPGNA
jgi:hypothetical protein